MTIPNPIEQGNGVNMFVRLWRAFILGSVCLVLLSIEMVLISPTNLPAVTYAGFTFCESSDYLILYICREFCLYKGKFREQICTTHNYYSSRLGPYLFPSNKKERLLPHLSFNIVSQQICLLLSS